MTENSEPGSVLGVEFCLRPTLTVCRDLIGSNLCCVTPDGSVRRLPIREVEAYDGFQDRASHAHRGVTARNSVMYGAGGYWYIYLCYGIHWMLNLVTREEGYPAAILIRGVGSILGPGKLTRALGIDRARNATLCHPGSGLWLEASDTRPRRNEVRRYPRVGVAYAGTPWMEKPWRFRWDPSPDRLSVPE